MNILAINEPDVASYLCQVCGHSWRSEEPPGLCPNRRCRAVNWETPRREYRICPVCVTDFETKSGSLQKYHPPCYKRQFNTSNRRQRREGTEEFNTVSLEYQGPKDDEN